MATKGFTDSQLKKAQDRAEDKAGFITHLIVYIIVIIGLAVINMLQEVEEWWFVVPAVVWGIGVMLHGIGVFIFDGYIEEYKENETKKELKRMKEHAK